MTLNRFTDQALSEWMKGDGPDSDIVISSRVRIARNLNTAPFPIVADDEQSKQILDLVTNLDWEAMLEQEGRFSLLNMSELQELEKRVLVEKHLISPALAEGVRPSGVMLSEDESISIMINEEDHLRIQCLFSGLQLKEAMEVADRVDDCFEDQLDYAFDEKRGYLTSCPTNVGTGIRASVMLHLPALVITQQINRILSAVNQVGLTVRGLYGEGSEAIGNFFQISNQITLGQNESEIIDSLHSVVKQIIEHERSARERLLLESQSRTTDRVRRSLGVLSYAEIMDSKEASSRLSDVRLGIDLGLIEHVGATVMNELLVMTQPGFLQQYAGRKLNSAERDLRRAEMIRQRLTEHSTHT